MRHFARLISLTLACAVASPLAFANAQHDRMRNCNKSAKEQALKGDERRAFMKQCLSGKHPAADQTSAQDAPQAKDADTKS